MCFIFTSQTCAENISGKFLRLLHKTSLLFTDQYCLINV
jgi:hypothetical protein